MINKLAHTGISFLAIFSVEHPVLCKYNHPLAIYLNHLQLAGSAGGGSGVVGAAYRAVTLLESYSG